MGIAEFSLFQVESYVGHVRTLTEERDAVASEYEKENEQLRLELAQLQLQQGNPSGVWALGIHWQVFRSGELLGELSSIFWGVLRELSQSSQWFVI